MKYQFISEHSSFHPVKKMCHALAVSRSGYYNWKNSLISSRELENKAIKDEISLIFNDHRGRIGSPMITPELRERGWPSISENRPD